MSLFFEMSILTDHSRLTTRKNLVRLAFLFPIRNSTNFPESINEFLSTYIAQDRSRTRNARQRHQAGNATANDESEEEDALVDDMDDMEMEGDEGRPSRTKTKYMKLLRKVANRQTTEVVIDLSDLKKVGLSSRKEPPLIRSSRKIPVSYITS
jgi:hypothetical protein